MSCGKYMNELCSFTGTAWAFARSGDSWARQPSPLTGPGAFGSSVALSANGESALVGDPVGDIASLQGAQLSRCSSHLRREHAVPWLTATGDRGRRPAVPTRCQRSSRGASIDSLHRQEEPMTTIAVSGPAMRMLHSALPYGASA